MKSWEESGEGAFPIQANEYGGHGSHHGMTLRDYFAAKAMQGLCVEAGNAQMEKIYESIPLAAKTAYAIADAMLAERAK